MQSSTAKRKFTNLLIQVEVDRRGRTSPSPAIPELFRKSRIPSAKHAIMEELFLIAKKLKQLRDDHKYTQEDVVLALCYGVNGNG